MRWLSWLYWWAFAFDDIDLYESRTNFFERFVCRFIGCKPEGRTWSEPYYDEGYPGPATWHRFDNCARCGSYIHVRKEPEGYDICDALAGMVCVYTAERGYLDPPEPFDCSTFNMGATP